MIILYIPFTRDEDGDLGNRAAKWQENHSVNSAVKIKIIYHNDNYEDEEIDPLSEIYVLGHGLEYDAEFIANSYDASKAWYMDVGALSERFNEDFALILHKISQIHLYCCGDQNKNKQLAQNFQGLMVRNEFSEINYYAGIINLPDKRGQKWTYLQGWQIPVESTKQTLNKFECTLEQTKNHFRSVEATALLIDLKKTQRYDHYLFSIKKARQKLIAEKREMALDDSKVQGCGPI